MEKMSENIPETSTTSPTPPLRKISKTKYKRVKLPTPPPDPNETAGSPNDKYKDFFDYLDSLNKSMTSQYGRSAPAFAPAIVTEEAFDHLEKLYKLMEQMLELRDQNVKLHRRIRDLEHLNNIEKMHKQLEISEVARDCPELDKDTVFAETILESILSDTRNEFKIKEPSITKLRPSILRRQRNSDFSAEKAINLDPDGSLGLPTAENHSPKPAKISKWTKVKAAFKWEKASPSVPDSKPQEGTAPVEIARYLRVPSTSEDISHSPVDSGRTELSTPASLSPTSSTEDFRRSELRIPYDDKCWCSDDEHSHSYIPFSKEEGKTTQKCHRTPWAKMKDIIQTRNSFKKKHRLSAQSDEVQIDIEVPSDDEDVFEDDNKNKIPIVPSSLPTNAHVYMRVNSSDIPAEIFERYQNLIAEDLKDSESKKISKWTRVKKAFLTTPETVKPEYSSVSSHPKNAETIHDIQAEIKRNYKQLQKKLSLEFKEKISEWDKLKQISPGTSYPSSTCGYGEENLDYNFIKKMDEWQKIKTHTTPQNVCDHQAPKEEDLPPEFRKKLDAWEKIKKTSDKEHSTKKKLGEVPRWKSLSGPRTERTCFEYPVLSESFKKKLEEWKQIKASGGAYNPDEHIKKMKDKTPSPKLSRKNSSPKQSKKQKGQEKELYWVEKELSKIEKEKQRLERERQKFIEREERLYKLRRAVDGVNKKEVLIHTPTGFYRFEGISQKFTQKLYEWEKAKGIGPEASTFALLTSSFDIGSSATIKPLANACPLTRSKSVDSIAISALSLTCPLISQQPSSLSLNDMNGLEKECMANSKSESLQYIDDTPNSNEPEALIVEVEDYEEETAAPLQTHGELFQLPIYHRQEMKVMCEGETVEAPKIRRSESTRAQTNYNWIEDIIALLKLLLDNELEIKKMHRAVNTRNESSFETAKIKGYYETQKLLCRRMSEKTLKLQEANREVVSTITKDDVFPDSHVADIVEVIQDLSHEITQMLDKIETEIDNRLKINLPSSYANNCSDFILESVNLFRGKVLQLRRNLSYMCAASDLTAPNRKRFIENRIVHKTLSSESKESRCDTSDNSRGDSEANTKDRKRYIKSDSANIQTQSAVRKRIKYKQKTSLNRSMPDSEEDEQEVVERKKNKYRKLTRTRSAPESTIDNFEWEEKTDTPVPVLQTNISETVGHVVVSANKFKDATICDNPPLIPKDETPVTIFVKTTRRLFTPIGETKLSYNIQTESSKRNEEVSQTIEVPQISIHMLDAEEQANRGTEKTTSEDMPDEVSVENEESQSIVTRLPPLPASPIPPRRIFRDISPSIRLMQAKYNMKISEQSSERKSGASSGSGSPLWQSPKSERRVRAQTERYQEEHKLSPLLGSRREVQKSASVGYISLNTKQTIQTNKDSCERNGAIRILKSSSAGVISTEAAGQSANHTKSTLERIPSNENDIQASKLHVSRTFDVHKTPSPDMRMKKLQKAKEDFLNSPQISTSSGNGNNHILKFPSRNRLSQISVESESSFASSSGGTLTKSISAGMINVDPDTYRQFDPEVHAAGYVSLPRNARRPKQSLLGGKFLLTNIASKFRKIKMRKGKDNKMNTVSVLCRQSLVVDISSSGESSQNVSVLPNSKDSSCEESPSISKSASWIKATKLFKK